MHESSRLISLVEFARFKCTICLDDVSVTIQKIACCHSTYYANLKQGEQATTQRHNLSLLRLYRVTYFCPDFTRRTYCASVLSKLRTYQYYCLLQSTLPLSQTAHHTSQAIDVIVVPSHLLFFLSSWQQRMKSTDLLVNSSGNVVFWAVLLASTGRYHFSH